MAVARLDWSEESRPASEGSSGETRTPPSFSRAASVGADGGRTLRTMSAPNADSREARVAPAAA